MNKVTVKTTVDMGLCMSCGICKSACPVDCINYERQDGMFYPNINEEKCVHCGKCADVCAGITVDYSEDGEDVPLSKAIVGHNSDVFCAWSKDSILRHIGASGGVVMTTVRRLLEIGEYDCVFCVTEYNYQDQVKTERLTFDEIGKCEKASKSRYIPISHENLIDYVKRNTDKRVIVIGVPCAISGFEKVLRCLGLKRENYLLIGLFCEGVFNYNINDWFSNDKFCDGKKLSAFHFKNKESGGWPGNMKLFFDDGSTEYVSANERYYAKKYFRSERCIYCIDKLNVKADISVGDNYTGENSSSLGSNSVIIRTGKGKRCFELCSDCLEVKPSSMEKVTASQQTTERENNYYYSLEKSPKLNAGIKADPRKAGKESAEISARLNSTKAYHETPSLFFDFLAKEERAMKLKKAVMLPRRVLGKIKRLILNRK